MKIRYLFVLAFLALAMPRGGELLAKNSLLEATDEICADVKKYLDTQGKNKVSIGQFIGKGPEALRASSQPLLKEALKASLKKNKIDVVETGAQYEVSGSYQAIEDSPSMRQAVILSVTVDDLKGNERKFTGVSNGKAEKYFFENVPDVAKVLGTTYYWPPPGKTKEEQVSDLKKSVDNPKCNLDGNRILAGSGAPFAIEILVAPPAKGPRKDGDYKSKKPGDHKGEAFVPITRNESYVVRLHNMSDYEVAVDLRLDGINMYYFSEARDKNGGPAYKYVVVAPKSYVDIKGWFINLKDSEEFVVVPRENSVVSQVTSGSPALVGTITALYHRTWDRKDGRPADEPANPDENSLSADATGRGQRFREEYEEVDYAVGTFRASVTARYSKNNP